jgi:hypothetical protein
MQYIVRFTATISWEGRTNGLPGEIYAFLIFDGYDEKVINKSIEAQMAFFNTSQAFFAQREQGALIDIRHVVHSRMTVPYHNVVYIKADIYPLGGEVSQPDEEGVERLSDGTTPTEH